MLAKVSGKETPAVVAALAAQVQHLPRELRLPPTWDQGKELADQKSLSLATKLDIYFCDLHKTMTTWHQSKHAPALVSGLPEGHGPVLSKPKIISTQLPENSTNGRE